MRDAVAEMSHYNEYDYVIINDDFSEALAQIIAIVTANRTRTARQKLQMASLLRDLLHDESSI
jgi:guanylate kinase